MKTQLTKHKTLFKAALFSALLAVSAPQAKAHHGAEATIPGANIAGPIITIPAHTLPKGKLTIGAGVSTSFFDRFSGATARSFNRRGVHGHNNGTIVSPTIFASYGLTEDLTVIASLPYVVKNDVQGFEDGRTVDLGTSDGLGDLTLLSQYRFLNMEEKKFSSALLLGLKVPTGATNQVASDDIEFFADEQPGTGSWDPLFGMAFSKDYDKFSLHSNVLYRLTTEGTQNTDTGEVFNYNLAVARRINCDGIRILETIFPRYIFGKEAFWSAVLELNGQWSEKVKANGRTDGNHGGNVIGITPGIRLNLDNDIVFNAAASIVALEDLNGIQSEPTLNLFFNIVKII